MASDADILDAAGALFAERGVEAVEMTDIARAAGCSRATLYRRFDSRAALRTAYVRREARRVAKRLADRTAGIADPHRRALTAMTDALALVRQNPSLAAWFATTPAGARAADSEPDVHAAATAFLRSLGPVDPAVAERRARWLVRMLASLLISPGRGEQEERAMLAEFVVPLLVPGPRTGGA